MAMRFVNGKIWQWPADAAQGEHAFATWMDVDASGAISAVGSDSPPPPSAPSSTEAEKTAVVDLAGALVLPGLHDSHIHAYFTGESAEYLDLAGCASFEDLSARLRAYDTQYPAKSWIVGFGWEQDTLSPSARYPSRHDLDAVIRDRPVLLHRACWHIAVVNTRALELAGVDAARTEPHALPAGSIDVDERGATGILREGAVELVTKHTNEQSTELRIKYLRDSLHKCARFGLTAIHTNDDDAWQLYSQIQREEGLPLRVYLTPLIDELGKSATPPPGATDGLLSCDRIKIFSDGSLGAETAALRTPYLGTTNTGLLMDTLESMVQKISAAHKTGYRLEIHAIGDRAAEQVLQALEQAGVPPERRPIMTHCQILGPDLLTQMQTQGVIGNIQPSFAITDAAFVRKRLPEHMLPYSYCWKTMLDSGIVCAGGSDAPIETCNPFQGIYDALYRRKPQDNETSAFLPEERVSFAQALAMYTKGGAFAAMEEHRLGQLAPGFQADFVVLRHDVATHPEHLLTPNLVQSVWVQGQPTYTYDPQRATPEKAPDFSQSSLPGKNGQIRLCRCCR